MRLDGLAAAETAKLRCLCSLKGRYQILQASPVGRAMGSPAWQEKAVANSGMFIRAPLARKRGSGCGSTVTIMRSYSGRAVVLQMRANRERSAARA